MSDIDDIDDIFDFLEEYISKCSKLLDILEKSKKYDDEKEANLKKYISLIKTNKSLLITEYNKYIRTTKNYDNNEITDRYSIIKTSSNNVIKRFDTYQKQLHEITSDNNLNVNLLEPSAIINKASLIQNNSKASLSRSIALVNKTEDIAIATAVKIKENTEQLKDIEAGVRNIESETDRGKKIIRQVTKKLITDKIAICLILLLVIGIITVIGLKASGKFTVTNKM